MSDANQDINYLEVDAAYIDKNDNMVNLEEFINNLKAKGCYWRCVTFTFWNKNLRSIMSDGLGNTTELLEKKYNYVDLRNDFRVSFGSEGGYEALTISSAHSDIGKDKLKITILSFFRTTNGETLKETRESVSKGHRVLYVMS